MMCSAAGSQMLPPGQVTQKLRNDSCALQRQAPKIAVGLQGPMAANSSPCLYSTPEENLLVPHWWGPFWHSLLSVLVAWPRACCPHTKSNPSSTSNTQTAPFLGPSTSAHHPWATSLPLVNIIAWHCFPHVPFSCWS